MTPDLTPREFLMMEQLRRAAEKGERCPNNRMLARAVGLGSDSKASQMMTALMHKGAISILSAGSSRVVTICDTGQSTAGKVDRPRQLKVYPVAMGPKIAPEPVNRDPCFACGVPEDRHHMGGCKRWRGR